jgi:hypothetical protein
MIYQDRIYGQTEIDEPVILALIDSSAMQRLKGVDQAGFRPFFIKPRMRVGKYDHSRFAHSVGVYLLLRKYHAPLEEQVAGLIHDVSHGAFSHCLDYALKSGSEKEHNHQDKTFAKFVRQTDIPKILVRYGFSLDYILNEKNFPLKEKALPDLCADRIDYSLRTALIFRKINKKFSQQILNNLITKKGQWIFKNFKTAKAFAQFFNLLNKKHYAGFDSAVMFRTVGDFVKHALMMGYINFADLYTTDNFVIHKVTKHLKMDKKLALFWTRMNDKTPIRNNPKDYDAQVFVKSRIVDPLFMSKNAEIKRLSQVSKIWTKVVAWESKPKEYFLKFG